MGPEGFFLEVANEEAWERLKVVPLQFEDVEIVHVSNSHAVVDGKLARRVITNIVDNLPLVASVERWVKTGR